jgi:hypothetical protein
VQHFEEVFKELDRENIEEILKVASYFPRLVGEEENERMYREVSREELLYVLNSFKKDRSPGPDGWTVEFYIEFFDLLGEDLLRVVEEVRTSGRVPVSFNSTFIALIPKVDCPETFEGFRPISLCNCIYKIISKVIVVRLKTVLSEVISPEQFGFLKGCQIHEAIGSTQEGLHTIKTSHMPAAVIKLDLSKAYDRVSWLYLHLLLIHIGFSLPLVKWIMGCVTIVSFAILINGSTSNFFKPSRGLRQGFPTLTLPLSFGSRGIK